MSDPTIAELQEQQETLQAAFEKEQKKFQNQRGKYAAAKQAYVDFNTQYGAMLKLVVVDPEAETAEESETAEE